MLVAVRGLGSMGLLISVGVGGRIGLRASPPNLDRRPFIPYPVREEEKNKEHNGR